MKILFLTKYDSMGASSRYRFFQFYDFYKENNIEITTQVFFDDKYIVDLYKGKRNIKSILKAYIKRFFVLFSVKKYNLLVVEKELFPYLPAIFERILKLIGIKYVVDYDDAIFHQYDNSNHKIIKSFLSNKIAKVMKYSSLVVAGNSYLANYATKKAGAKATVVPTVIDLDKYDKVVASQKDNKEVVIGWIGSPSTSKYLTFLEDVFIELSQKYSIKVHIIGSTVSPFKNFNAKLIKWSENSEIEEMKKFDIGVMPLLDNPWERGKCGFKLIQYMGCSLPVIGSPVGVNCEIIDNGKNGFLAITIEEWKNSLEILITDLELRKQMGKEGREKVERCYSKNAVKNELLSIYKTI
jgi:glycosyltransferase involved in cell wall biosynthesis